MTVHRPRGKLHLTANGPIGVLGGTFDPIHLAHLRLAEELADVFGLQQVRFIPAAIPPHRPAPTASAAQRLEMLQLAVAGNIRFEVDARELSRQGLSFTFDTLTQLREETGRTLCLMMGADAFVALATWHRWRELFDLAHLIVARRPGYSLEEVSDRLPAPLKAEYLRRHSPDVSVLGGERSGRIFTHELTAMEVSASALRNLIARGKSPRYLLPEAVIAYIEGHGLYRDNNAG